MTHDGDNAMLARERWWPPRPGSPMRQDGRRESRDERPNGPPRSPRRAMRERVANPGRHLAATGREGDGLRERPDNLSRQLTAAFATRDDGVRSLREQIAGLQGERDETAQKRADRDRRRAAPEERLAAATRAQDKVSARSAVFGEAAEERCGAGAARP